MPNFYYGYSIVWLIILVSYFFGFSDLCRPLDSGLLIFIISSIFASFGIGYKQRKKFKEIELTDNPHKKKYITAIFLILFILEFIIEHKIPLLNVIRGESYGSFDFYGIKGLHMILGGLAIIYSFYLSYLFSIFRKPSLLFENLSIIFYFCLLIQRQNILICLIGLLVCLIYPLIRKTFDKNHKKEKKKNIAKIVALLLSVLVILFGFGAIGNFRYGSRWKWYDTTMIEKLGRMNDRYPSFIPKQYFWSYVYAVTPLANLNANVEYFKNSGRDLKEYLYEYVPEYIENKIGHERGTVILPVPSLTAGTAYVGAFKYLGYFGMYLMFAMYMLVTTLILNLCFKNNKEMLAVVCFSLTYFLLLSFFDNSFVYPTTSVIVVAALFLSFKYKRANKDEKRKVTD